ncbi:hypothetical protein ATM17_15835 [Sphingopyxis macrogoltabida]|uniref:Uncharacterized protein n=1 Tax=Sphingopyxis macrogoltabida TaxID=33050 RepID=A0AAC8Z221_SPHMC|nr:hypothetical protein ATM17_15835 [Sphingopyxis macrogoltabida]
MSIFRKRIGPWRATRDEALEDAVRTGNGSLDRYSEMIYLTVPADIISRYVEVQEVRPKLRAVG